MGPSVIGENDVTTLEARLRERRDLIAQRWLNAVLATYSKDGAAAFQRQRDPFANPVGHHLRTGTQAIVEALATDADTERIERALHDIIRIRAIQQFSASEALSFVFGLKDAIRAECTTGSEDPHLVPAWIELDRRIDRIALTAFDIYTAYREQVCDLRINDVKRNVSRIWERMNQPRVDRETE